MNKNKYGQYFTPAAIVEFMIELADINPSSKILEPSCGEGVFIEQLKDKGFDNIVGYEIDNELGKKTEGIKYESFVSANIEDKFDLIIGNPPYIRWKNLEEELKKELESNALWNKYFNTLCDYLYIFILKSIELLKDEGQLIFICPEYWLNTTHSFSLRNYMAHNGGFEKLFKFNETKIFDNVNVSLIVFKYVKTTKPKNKFHFFDFNDRKCKIEDILYILKSNKSKQHQIDVNRFKVNERWLFVSNEESRRLIHFESACKRKIKNQKLFDFEDVNLIRINDICTVRNGLVSGLDRAFKIENTDRLNELELNSTLNVIKGYNLNQFIYKGYDKYIYLNDREINEEILRNDYPQFYLKLNIYKEILENRYRYNGKVPYWNWVFLRNFDSFRKNESKIYVPSKNRISQNKFFKFCIVENGFFPTQDVSVLQLKNTTKESIYYICAYLNHPMVFNWIKHNGIIKGNIVEFSAKPLKSVPFRIINWSKQEEVRIHDKIKRLVKEYIKKEESNILKDINENISLLID